jgi:hypothetical protein
LSGIIYIFPLNGRSINIFSAGSVAKASQE